MDLTRSLTHTRLSAHESQTASASLFALELILSDLNIFFSLCIFFIDTSRPLTCMCGKMTRSHFSLTQLNSGPGLRTNSSSWKLETVRLHLLHHHSLVRVCMIFIHILLRVYLRSLMRTYMSDRVRATQHTHRLLNYHSI